MYEQLFQLGGAFFNQDFWSEYSTADAAIVDFGRLRSADSVENLLRELREILVSDMSESELEHLWLDESAAHYDPVDDGYTYRGWFEHVRDLLTQ